MKFWDVGEYKVLFNIQPESRASGTSVCIGDGMSVIGGWKDGFMRCYDPKTKQLLWAIPNAHKGKINSIYADANYILSGGDDGPIRVWARQTRQLLIQLAG